MKKEDMSEEKKTYGQHNLNINPWVQIVLKNTPSLETKDIYC